ncbi:MAG: DUF72 domain-containing protein [Candidatus Nezhaarchaeales archaeon]
MSLKVGCCGWAVKGGMEAYFKTFKVIELQSTFYKLPRIETAINWRRKAPDTFEYTLKCWQACTHPATSPTWRKAGIRVPSDKTDKYGLLKPTKENFEAWERTIEVAKALRAVAVIVQLPPAFDSKEANLDNAYRFFKSVKRDDINVVIEFRNRSWTLELVSSLCQRLNLIHAVDPFKEATATKNSPLIYYRLHGLGRRMYVYDYNDEEHIRLYREYVKPYVDRGKDVYVLFNNTNMVEDAKRFMEIAGTENLNLP